jgi:hypothetical protein
VNAHSDPPRTALGGPLKAWGDALMEQGKTQDAQFRYEEALTFAPTWQQLAAARAAAVAER